MSVAKSYANALLQAARESKVSDTDIDRMDSELSQLEAAIQGSEGARIAFLSPAVSAKEKAAVIQEFAKKIHLGPLMSQFLVLLARKERLSLVPAIRSAFAIARLEAEGGMLGNVVSADPMDPSDVASLAQSFSKKLGRKVAFNTSTDPSLLAGMKVTVNGVTYDGTLRNQLQRLRDRLVFQTGSTH